MKTPCERSSEYSEDTLAKIRYRLGKLPLGNKIVLACGSYARREASENSDVDFFMVSDNPDDYSSPIDRVRSAIKEVVPNEPSPRGAFGGPVDRRKMLENIGGEDDDNQNITRRILFLLEGEWLFNEEGLRGFRREILDRYIRPDMTDHQLAMFLLNDIIRYYRTVAVDYEFKTGEGDNPKPWAIRNIKLVFSRKLLYASGLFSVAKTVDCVRDEKIEVLEALFEIPVIERMTSICGKSSMEPVVESYNHFLEKMEDVRVRKNLEELKRSEREDPGFRELKDEGHRFTQELLKLFENTFDSTHPIRRAVVF